MQVFAGLHKGVAPPEAAGGAIAPGELEVKQWFRSLNGRIFNGHAQRYGGLHNHLVVANGINVVRGYAVLFQKFEEMGSKPAGYGPFPGNLAHHAVVAGVENGLAVFHVSRGVILKDKPVLAPILPIGNLKYILGFSADNKLLVVHSDYVVSQPQTKLSAKNT